VPDAARGAYAGLFGLGGSLGPDTRFVVDDAACPVLLVWPRGGHHSPAATSPFPTGSLKPRNPDTARNYL